jgi:hypothetical protein
MMRLGAILGMLCVLYSCSGSTTKPLTMPDVAGTYQLQSIGGNSLPYRTASVQFNTGSVVLSPSGSVMRSHTYQLIQNGQPGVGGTSRYNGVYQLRGDSIFVNVGESSGGYVFEMVVRGTTLRAPAGIVISDPFAPYVYVKQ